MADELSTLMEARLREADSTDYSRLAWLRLHLNDVAGAHSLVSTGLKMDPENLHLQRLKERWLSE